MCVGGGGGEGVGGGCIKPEALSLISRKRQAFSQVFSRLLFISLLNLPFVHISIKPDLQHKNLCNVANVYTTP